MARLSYFSLNGSTRWGDEQQQILQCHWQGARLMILGHFPQEGPTMENTVFIWHEWLGDYVIKNALHPHTNTCYIQSGPHLASAFLMWMHCSDLGKHFVCCWAEIAPHTDIKALLRQALYGMFCQMVPFPSSSHFLVLLQPLENANPFIRLCIN